ncbi:MAG TPA: DUF3987 domain-containing protein [Acidimicrobiales bacterium]|nr:DUF3987 domain-containing protein [Acidimicrobiales bacterium]
MAQPDQAAVDAQLRQAGRADVVAWRHEQEAQAAAEAEGLVLHDLHVQDDDCVPCAEIEDQADKGRTSSATSARSDRGKRPWPVLDPAALHGVVGEIVRAIEPRTEADPAALAAELLCAAGNAIGSGPHALADGAQHPARLFVVLVGKTARARKGTARGQRARIMQVASPEWADNAPWSGFGSGEAVVAELAMEGRDCRMLVEESEFAKVLAVCERDGSTLSGMIRDAWDGVPLRRRTVKERAVVTTHHVSVAAHITLDEVRRSLTDTQAANGFGNRFLWVCCRRTKLLPDGASIDQAATSRLGVKLRERIEGARRRGLVGRNAAAAARWDDLYRHMGASEPPGLWGAVTARAEAQLLRLSLLYALLDASPTIDAAHVEAAWAFWRYCDASAAYIFGDATGDPAVDRLITAVRRAGARGLDGAALDALLGGKKVPLLRQRAESYGQVVTVAKETGGRPRLVTYHIDHAPQPNTEGERP